MTEAVLDELDHRLIEVLSRDARVSNRNIAKQFGINEGTVRSRLKRMQQERLLTFTAITSLDVSQVTQMAFIRAQTDLVRAPEIAVQVTELPGVDAVMMTMGNYNLLVVCLFDTIANLHELASNRILGLPGVRHITTAIAVRTLKYNTRVVRITSPKISADCNPCDK